jgi:hypothetical protein
LFKDSNCNETILIEINRRCSITNEINIKSYVNAENNLQSKTEDFKLKPLTLVFYDKNFKETSSSKTESIKNYLKNKICEKNNGLNDNLLPDNTQSKELYLWDILTNLKKVTD